MNKLSGTLRLSMSFALLLGLATHGMAGDAGLCAHEDAHDLQAVEADARLEADGKKLEYKARWTPLYLDDETGCPAAVISATSYTVETDPAGRRPLVFLFNGGPGASSSPLHFTLGPKRLQTGENGERVLSSNPESLLKYADLVFIDPVGTGFSRNFAGNTPYWNRQGDAESVVAYINYWLESHGRADSDYYLVGESYGAYRLAEMLPRLPSGKARGAVLVSPAIDFGGQSDSPGSELVHVSRLPTMAVAAWHHGKAHTDIERSDENAERVWKRAGAFAETDYLTALFLGNRLGAEDRHMLATRVSSMTGVDLALVKKHDLKLPVQEFLNSLLDGKEVGRLDVRISAPRERESASSDRPAGANDPALGLGQSNKIRSEPIRRYLVNDLGVDTDLGYYSLNLDLNFEWDWRSRERAPEFRVNPSENLANAMHEKSSFRLLVIGGFFDMATPVKGVEHTFTRSIFSPGQIELLFVPTGHSPFSSDRSRPALTEAVGRFIQNQ